MQFQEYQTISSKFEKDRYDLPYLLIGLSNEVGELLGVWKKLHRDGTDTAKALHDMRLEAGDVLWYLTRVTERINSSLADIAIKNIRKLQHRHGNGAA